MMFSLWTGGIFASILLLVFFVPIIICMVDYTLDNFN